MIDTEMLKQTIVERRIELAGLMLNAQESMNEVEFNDMKAKVQRLHLFDRNNDIEGSLQATEELIAELQQI
ncbi:MAG: hypothetical protein EBY39_02755 [Flavobacteriia bacterium]|nr:hypothetical protein [Flavobacteriia bacterium]